MRLEIPYDSKCLKVELPLPPKNVRILESNDPSPKSDVETIIGKALEKPIGRRRISDIVHAGQKVAVLFDDWTRPTPVSRIMPSVLEELSRGGISEDNVVLVSSNGMHDPRYVTKELMIQKLGKEIYRRYRVISHDAYDRKKMKFIGTTQTLGTPLFINREVAEADFRISVGRTAPHTETGYSGGAKMIMPGVSSVWTIIHHHSGSYSRRGVLENPLRDDIEECGRMANLDFIVSVVYNSQGKVVKAFAGDPVWANRMGIEYGDSKVWGAKFTEPAEIVIISPGMNQDSYFIPSMRCLGVADRCLKENGTIIVVASCREGWSEPRLLQGGWHPTPELLKCDYPDLVWLVASKAWHQPNRQFQALVYYVQHIAKICKEQNVILAGSKGLTKEEAERLHLNWFASCDEAIGHVIEKYSRRAKTIVIPSAFTLPLKSFYKVVRPGGRRLT